jgi:septation ring formation regulator EzrA
MNKKNNNKYVSMKDYVDNRFDAARAAVEVVAATTNTRLEGTNEWRQTYGDAQKNFPTRVEMNAAVEEIRAALTDVEREYREQGRALSSVQTILATLQSRLSAMSIALAVLGIVAGIVVPILIIKLM